MIKMIKVEDLLKFYNWNTTHISMGKCHQLKEEGYLHMKKHVKYPLYLLNYTSKTQYQQKWCKELIHTRGMVVDEDGQIIARPYSNFSIYQKSLDGMSYKNKSMNYTRR